MTEWLTLQNVTFSIGMLGVIFTIYRYFKEPQTRDEKAAALLSQKVQWICDSFESRYKSIQDNFNSLLLQSNNHIHGVDVKVDKLSGVTENLALEVTKLATIIDERIPRKTL